MAGKDPDWLARVLYAEITKARSDPVNNKYPAWKVMAQIVKDPSMSPVNIFDATKILPENVFPWKEFGKITLTECPQNFFTQVEQAAFNPANIVPGWDISPDPRTSGPVDSYDGANFQVSTSDSPVRLRRYTTIPSRRQQRPAAHKPAMLICLQPHKARWSVQHDQLRKRAQLHSKR